MQKKIKQFIFLIFILYSILGYLFIYRIKYNEIKERLQVSATNLEFYLGKNFHTKDMDEKTYTIEEILKVSLFLNKLAELNKVSYLYTIVEKGNQLYYTTSSDPRLHEEMLMANNKLTDEEKSIIKENYWYSLVDSKDNTIPLMQETIKKNKLTFTKSKDLWGSYIDIYLPAISSDGTKYILGADVKLTHFYTTIFKDLFLAYFYGILFAFITYKVIQSEKKKTNEILSWHENTDQLTGLPNRTSFENKVNQIISTSDATFYLGVSLRNLNSINGHFGLKEGDQYIKMLARIINNSIKNEGTVARIASGDFLITPEVQDEKEIKKLEFSIKNEVSNFNKKNQKGYIFDIATFTYSPKATLSAATIIDILMEDFNTLKKGSILRNLQKEVMDGIYGGEFLVYYQPKVDTISGIIEYEALIRWNHPEKGFIPPDQFIPQIEHSKMIFPLTDFVIREAIKASKILNGKISVNISRFQFREKNFVQDLEASYKHFENIEFEITETMTLNGTKYMASKMKELTKLGLTFSLDDFGTGYSSLSNLAELPLDSVKIDKSFIDSLSKENGGDIIVRAIISLGKSLGMKVIAEGVETREQIMTLQSFGCNIFQGYYFSKPLPLESIILEKDSIVAKIEEFK